MRVVISGAINRVNAYPKGTHSYENDFIDSTVRVYKMVGGKKVLIREEPPFKEVERTRFGARIISKKTKGKEEE